MEASLHLELEAVEAQIEALDQARIEAGGADKDSCGALVGIERSGILVVHRGVTLAADQKRSAQAGSTASVRSEVPEKLMLNLSSHRTAALQASLLEHPNVALASLANTMALSVFGLHQSTPVKLSLSKCRYTLEKNAPTLGASRAATALDTATEAFKRRLPADPKDWFKWFLSQPQSESVQMIVLGTAHSTDAIQTDLNGRDDAAPMAGAVALDMADWWEATPESYLDLVPKAKIIEAVADAAGAEVAASITKMKKSEACTFAASTMLGKRWLPKALKTRSA